ncbi:sensor histidine kinase [Streptomyces sp. HUAS TT20]|uniref:sensor histidine kinase n=1 Tax=Streptomyces sp. HUAS TT20 TaxID=3447509 RepID=UPI0021DB2A94|nr:HAMP domain-containing sensor histidine kinase [Streptomyces sp. HUAS 15-9]UXY31765.1 HAMP domain-containing histidine kinase [Streptomyces sp. HUAS 15-9]
MRLSVLTRVPQSAYRLLVPKRIRLRLTLLYGFLFVLSGAVLLVITYLLVSNATSSFITVESKSAGPRSSGGDSDKPSPGLPPDIGGVARQFGEQSVRQHGAQMHDLLVQSGIALAITTVISIALGWAVAGRVLRPLRTMTSTIRRISARNVHERLAFGGPRDELTELADTVDGLLGRLETALDSHKRFVANAAHELRTPLTLEHALLEESLIDREATLDSFRENFERLLTISKQQARLLESLLTLSSSERGVDRQEQLDLAVLTRQVVDTFRPQIERRGLRLEASVESAAVTGDSALVERLVANLLDNAVDYNVPGGVLELRTAVENGRAVVSVANTGQEISPEQVDRLFEPFQRLHRTAGDDHHGLGLSIVRAIAAAHGATLTARARPDGGLSVVAAFPLRRADASHGPRGHQPPYGTNARTGDSLLARAPERG